MQIKQKKNEINRHKQNEKKTINTAKNKADNETGTKSETKIKI